MATLTADLAALHSRQTAVLQALRSRSHSEQELFEPVDAVFQRVPEYVAKLTEVQRTMDELQVRAASMRSRCEGLLQE